MNFLSHDVVLPEGVSPLVRVGAALPDLWPVLTERPRPTVVLRALSASEEPRARELGVGIDLHMRADAAFHGHPEFFRRMKLLRSELCVVWPALGGARFASHLMVEMLLDQWLVVDRPERVADYYRAFDDETLDYAAAHGTLPGAGAGLRALLGRFVTARFLDDYATAEGLVPRFVRALGRARSAPRGEAPVDALVAFVTRWGRQMDAGTSELLAFVRGAITPAS